MVNNPVPIVLGVYKEKRPLIHTDSFGGYQMVGCYQSKTAGGWIGVLVSDKWADEMIVSYLQKAEFKDLDFWMTSAIQDAWIDEFKKNAVSKKIKKMVSIYLLSLFMEKIEKNATIKDFGKVAKGNENIFIK